MERTPDRLTFEQAAALPLAGNTALMGLRDLGRVQPGQRVLVNGASGDITPRVDRTYPLAEASEAIRYVEVEHARAKVVITV